MTLCCFSSGKKNIVFSNPSNLLEFCLINVKVAESGSSWLCLTHSFSINFEIMNVNVLFFLKEGGQLRLDLFRVLLDLKKVENYILITIFFLLLLLSIFCILGAGV